MKRASRFALSALLFAGAAATVAHADVAPLGPEQQQGLAAAMRDWTLTPFGNGALAQPFTPSVEGDHYRLDVPFRSGGAQAPLGSIVIDAKPLDGGRWSLDTLPLSTSVDNVTPPAGSPPKERLAFGLQGFVSHSIVDPSLAATSNFDASGTGLALAAAAPKINAIAFTTGKFVTRSLWQPAGPGHVDATTSQSAEGVAMQTLGGIALRITFHRIAEERRTHLFAPAKQAEASRLLALLTPSGPVSAAAPLSESQRSQLQRSQLHGAVDALRDASADTEGAVGLEGIGFQVANRAVNLEKVAFGYSISRPAGRADVKLRMSLDGIDARPIPLSDLLPQHVVLALHLAGAPVADVFDAVSKAIDKGDMQPAMVMPAITVAMLRLPLTTSLDEFSFAMGPAKWVASGTLHSAGPQDIAGDALVKATGLDALIRLASTDSRLRGLAPRLVFLKGIGQQDGDSVIWKVVRAGNKTTVNGSDLSQLVRGHA